jgi:23S rRNA (cytosine1962-C5)-methyltransferase
VDLPPAPAHYPCVPLAAHALLDSGGGWKLERYGELVLARPDPQALWRTRLAPERWQAAHLRFERESDRGGRWERGSAALPAGVEWPPRAGELEWEIELEGARCALRLTPFKHLGLFPEQAVHWRWTRALALEGFGARASGADRPRLLNLFGYTGIASVLAARAGFAVTHVDAARGALAWTRENARRSGLTEGALRLVHDDALAFARREQRRGARYEGILLDPPHYGRGPKGEKWQLETSLAPLVEACGALLAPRAFLLLSCYAVGYSPLALENLLAELGAGERCAAELVLREEPGAQAAAGAARYLPCGFSARFVRELPLAPQSTPQSPEPA